MDFRIDAHIAVGVDDSHLAWNAISRLWDAVDFSSGPRAVNELLGHATLGQRALFAIDWLQKEVRNGGFGQFFENRAGMLAHDALDGFLLVGAGAYAELVSQAIDAFPGHRVPQARTARVRALRQIPDRKLVFEALDDAFLDLIESDDLETYRGGYVRHHPEEFLL
jgi:hypothetical protein